MTKLTVRIETKTVGQHFGTSGGIRDAKTGRKLAETERTYPYQFNAAAYAGAEDLAAKRGWTVVNS